MPLTAPTSEFSIMCDQRSLHCAADCACTQRNALHNDLQRLRVSDVMSTHKSPWTLENDAHIRSLSTLSFNILDTLDHDVLCRLQVSVDTSTQTMILSLMLIRVRTLTQAASPRRNGTQITWDVIASDHAVRDKSGDKIGDNKRTPGLGRVKLL